MGFLPLLFARTGIMSYLCTVKRQRITLLTVKRRKGKKMIYALTTAMLAAMAVSLYGVVVSFSNMLGLHVK